MKGVMVSGREETVKDKEKTPYLDGLAKSLHPGGNRGPGVL
jgi:hypothetical protein